MNSRSSSCITLCRFASAAFGVLGGDFLEPQRLRLMESPTSPSVPNASMASEPGSGTSPAKVRSTISTFAKLKRFPTKVAPLRRKVWPIWGLTSEIMPVRLVGLKLLLPV